MKGALNFIPLSQIPNPMSKEVLTNSQTIESCPSSHEKVSSITWNLELGIE